MLMGDGRMKAILVADDDVGPRELLRSAHTTYLTCYQELRAAGDPRVESVLTAGYALRLERATQFVDAERRARFLDNLPVHRTLLHAWRDYSRWTMGAGEHDADASVAPRAFDNRQPTPLRIVRRKESS
jgi:hypothetical protein